MTTGLAHAADLLSDPGFESTTITTGETNVASGWNVYGYGNNSLTENNSAIAHSGSNYLKVFQGFTGQINYSGAYQDMEASAGDTFTADGWIKTVSTDQLAGDNQGWIEVTFRDGAANVLSLYRTALVVTNIIGTGGFPVNAWNDLAVTYHYDLNYYTIDATNSQLVAPVGTLIVRYQIVLQGDTNTSGGSLYFDDLTLTKIASGTNSPASGTNWNVVWNDEFNGTKIDTNHWKFEIGNGSGGWGNNELEYYTNAAQNAYVSNGLLHIVALKQSVQGFNYTSARMKTQDLFSKTRGRFEFRAKLPTGKGYWPALWLFPQSSYYGNWASSGEIDITENMGSVPTTVLGTIHYGAAYPGNVQSFGPSYTFPSGNSVTNFHNYMVEWGTNYISWFVDNQLYEQATNWYSTGTNGVQNPFPAPFNQPFFIIMNLAVGGNFDGNPTVNTVFPGDMQVDYVRVYDQTAPLQISFTNTSAHTVLSWPTNIVCHLQTISSLTGATWIDLSVTNSPYAVPTLSSNQNVFYRLASP